MTPIDPQADDFGDEWDDARFVRDHLTTAMRRRICGWPSYTRNDDGSPVDGFDHGHTDCYFMGLAADEIDRLRHALRTAEMCAGLVQAAIHQGLHPEDFPDANERDPQNDRDMGRD